MLSCGLPMNLEGKKSTNKKKPKTSNKKKEEEIHKRKRSPKNPEMQAKSNKAHGEGPQDKDLIQSLLWQETRSS